MENTLIDFKESKKRFQEDVKEVNEIMVENEKLEKEKSEIAAPKVEDKKVEDKKEDKK